MAYPNTGDRQYKQKSPEESLHWICHNLKKLSEDVKRIADVMTNTPVQAAPPSQYRQPYQYQAPKQEPNLPF